MPTRKLTDERIRGAQCPKGVKQVFLWDVGTPLGVRITAGNKAYIFQAKLAGATVRVTIGDVSAWALGKARVEARRLKTEIDNGRDPRQEKAARLAALVRERAAAAKAESDAKHTLEALFGAYVETLKQRGKTSARAAECMFNLHVVKAHPEIAAKAAATITAKDIVALLRPLTEATKGRQAGKLRSYLRAAFALGARAETDSDVPSAFLAFGLDSNPVAATASLTKYIRALERSLSDAELRAYYAAVQALEDSPIRDALLLGLLLGGQRTAQICRVKIADVDADANRIRLLDPKGKRAQARVHVLPLTTAAKAVVDRCLARAKEQESPWLLSYSKDAALRAETVTKAATEIAAALLAMPKAERVVQTAFTLRDIRRTAETQLAALGVSKDTRAQVLSHGIGGVQSKHYDRHDYMPEKTAALAAWAEYLERAPATNVHEIGKGKRGKRKAAA